jgi:hypothetical protein
MRLGVRDAAKNRMPIRRPGVESDVQTRDR